MGNLHKKSKKSNLAQTRSIVMSIFVVLTVVSVFVWTAGFIFSTEFISDDVDYPADFSDPVIINGTETAAPETTVPPETTAAPETTVPPETTTAPETTVPPETTTAPETTVPPETTAAPETTVPPETAEITEPSVPGVYDYASPVPEADAVDDSYFQDAVFIGDSRTVGFSMHSGIQSIYYALTGLNISNLDELAFLTVTQGDGTEVKMTVMQALEYYNNYSKVYISLGLNELGWGSADYFVKVYSEAVSEIKAIHPGVEIYVQGIIPMSERASNTNYKDTGNPRIKEFNALLAEMCAEQQVYYLDLYPHFATENDALPDDAANDGVHFSRPYYREWADYLRKHTVNQADYVQQGETVPAE